MTVCAKVRETPYLTSAQVIGEPSSNLEPSFSVKAQVLPPSVGLPVSVARSGTTLPAATPSLLFAYAVSVRVR